MDEKSIDNNIFKSFIEIRESLRDLPSTWYPGLLTILIEESYKQKTFKPGGASEYVQIVENRIKEDSEA